MAAMAVSDGELLLPRPHTLGMQVTKTNSYVLVLAGIVCRSNVFKCLEQQVFDADVA